MPASVEFHAPDDAPPNGTETPPAPRSAPRLEWLVYLAAMATATVLGGAALGAFENLATVPFAYAGDGAWSLVSVKGLTENWQPYTNLRLGAPGTYQTYDFPTRTGCSCSSSGSSRA